MKIVSVAQMRELDRRTIEEAGIPGSELMDRAGRGVAESLHRLADLAGLMRPSALLIAGRGNNGGDAFAAARYLREMDFEVTVWIAGAERQIQGDALHHLNLLKTEYTDGIAIEEFAARSDWEHNLAVPFFADFTVDALLGTGSSGPARGPVAWAIQYLNTIANDSFIVSVDVPSGLNADTGGAEGDAVSADVTVTLGLPKRGLVTPAATEFVGCLEVVDIGIPRPFIEAVPGAPGLEMIYSSDLKRLLPRRARTSHKGTYGHVMLIGGGRGYGGAIALAARAAARSGVGLTSALVPAGIASMVAGASLETMVHPGAETAGGSLAATALDAWADRWGEFGAVLVGPGLTRHPDSAALVRRLLAECTAPLVLDADALNVLEGEPELLAGARTATVLTPHPGELSRLLGRSVADIQSDRLAAVREAAARTRAVVVLKGAGTLVADRERSVAVNLTGNPGMATGGCGDVLAGLLTGLLGQGLAPYDAARAAVFLHGRAGDSAMWRSSQAGMLAGDMVNEIPFAFRELTWR